MNVHSWIFRRALQMTVEGKLVRAMKDVLQADSQSVEEQS